MADEWGPWIEHLGDGCPASLVGKTVECEYTNEDGTQITGYRVADPLNELLASCASWHANRYMNSGNDGRWEDWSGPMEYVIRYRIRKPRGMEVLQEILTDLPQPEKVDA